MHIANPDGSYVSFCGPARFNIFTIYCAHTGFTILPSFHQFYFTIVSRLPAYRFYQSAPFSARPILTYLLFPGHLLVLPFLPCFANFAILEHLSVSPLLPFVSIPGRSDSNIFYHFAAPLQVLPFTNLFPILAQLSVLPFYRSYLFWSCLV